MVDFKRLEQEMDETRRQIQLTCSKQRKWELHRHLEKLKKEYKTGKLYYYAGRRKEGHGG